MPTKFKGSCTLFDLGFDPGGIPTRLLVGIRLGGVNRVRGCEGTWYLRLRM